MSVCVCVCVCCVCVCICCLWKTFYAFIYVACLCNLKCFIDADQNGLYIQCTGIQTKTLNCETITVAAA